VSFSRIYLLRTCRTSSLLRGLPRKRITAGSAYSAARSSRSESVNGRNSRCCVSKIIRVSSPPAKTGKNANLRVKQKDETPLSRSAFEQARNPRGSPPACWPLGPRVSCDADYAGGHSQRFARPSSWGSTLLVCSSFILSLCKMWVRIRPEGRGVPMPHFYGIG
jgi:hypothetical protein